MKYFSKLFSIFVLYSILLATSSAQSGNQPPQKPSCMGMGGMHKSMMGNMTDEQKDKHLRAKQEHMLQMHKLSDQILSTDDPEAKQMLKQQQLDLMKAKMAKMKARMAKSMENCNMNMQKQGQKKKRQK